MGNTMCICCHDKRMEDDPQNTSVGSTSKRGETPKYRIPEEDPEKEPVDSKILNQLSKAVVIGERKGNPEDHYIFRNRLGKGSFGEVFKAKNTMSGNEVAIKIITKRTGQKNGTLSAEIINEINVLKTIDHQNILKIFEFYEGEESYFIVTEYCRGGTLFDKVNYEGPFNEKLTAIIMFQLFSAINYCHKKKIMHRDLKPENIMLESKNGGGYPKVKIIDFGTAKIFKDIERQIIGTPFYIAPEVLDKKYTEKCDLWSLGVIMYVLLKKRFPFGGNNNKQIFQNIRKAEYDLVGKPFDTISNEAKDLIRKLIVKDPSDRISAEEALEHPWFKINKTKEKLTNLKPEKITELLKNIRNYLPSKTIQQAALAYLVHNFPQNTEIQSACTLFAKIDTDNDGVLTEIEFISGVKKLLSETGGEITDTELEEIFKIIDSDGSGDLEYEEFVRAAVNKKIFLEDELLHFAFDFFDKDKSGTITLEEISEVFSKEKKFSEDEFKNIIKQVDKNGDGVIDFKEFQEVMGVILN